MGFSKSQNSHQVTLDSQRNERHGISLHPVLQPMQPPGPKDLHENERHSLCIKSTSTASFTKWLGLAGLTPAFTKDSGLAGPTPAFTKDSGLAGPTPAFTNESGLARPIPVFTKESGLAGPTPTFTQAHFTGTNRLRTDEGHTSPGYGTNV